MPVTIRDVARQTSLSHTTVSRVLSNRNAINIPDVTRARVREAAREMGYRPNLNARALVTGRSNIIVLQLFRFDSPLCAQVARTLQGLAWKDGYEILVHEFDGRSDQLSSIADGVLLHDRVSPRSPGKSELEDALPSISLGALHANTGDFVGVDLYQSSRQMMQLLLASQPKRIVYLGDVERDSDPLDERLVAYLEAVESVGIAPEIVSAPVNTRLHGRQLITRYTKEHGRPDAVFCVNDELAVGCYRAMHDLGVSIPGDVKIVGCDGIIEETEYLQPPLTTIVQPVAEMCRIAWGYMKERIIHPDAPLQQTMLAAQVRLGGSHGE